MLISISEPKRVPGRILVALVAKLRVYGFWRREGRFPELLRILEKDRATGLGVSEYAWRLDGIGGANWRDIGVGYLRDGFGALACCVWYWLSQCSRREAAEWKS